MLRRLLLIVGGLVLVLVAAGAGVVALLTTLDNDMYGGGPTSAAFVDQALGTVDPKGLDLTGDLLLTSKHTTGLQVRPLADLSKEPLTLFGAMFVESIGPDGRHVVAWTGSRWQLVRLADLHAVAEVQGADPFFIDPDRVLALFEGKGCGRRDATILDLRRRTQHAIKLSGDGAGLIPVAMDGGEIVVQRQARGDSGCVSAGFARVDLTTGAVTTIATSGSVSAVVAGHVWLNEGDETRVFDRNGLVVTTSMTRVTAEAVEHGVVYAETPFHLRGGGIPADAPTRLRLGTPTGPRPEDPAGDELTEPEEISVVQDGAAVLVAHRGSDLPNGGHATVLSRCSLPQLRCRELLDVTNEIPRLLAIVGADVFRE